MSNDSKKQIDTHLVKLAHLSMIVWPIMPLQTVSQNHYWQGLDLTPDCRSIHITFVCGRALHSPSFKLPMHPILCTRNHNQPSWLTKNVCIIVDLDYSALFLKHGCYSICSLVNKSRQSEHNAPQWTVRVHYIVKPWVLWLEKEWKAK